MALRRYNAAGELLSNEPGFAPQSVLFWARRATDSGTLAAGYAGAFSFDGARSDPYGWFDGTKFNPRIPGYYKVSSTITISGGTSGQAAELYLQKNTTSNNPQTAMFGGDLKNYRSDGWITLRAEETVYLNGTAGDYVAVSGWSQSGWNVRGTSNVPSSFSAELVGASVGVTPEPWIPMTGFVNSWTQYAPCYYMKDPHGFVHIKGEIAPGSTNAGALIVNPAFPAGYRPMLRRYFALSGGTGTASVLGHFMIDTTGNIKVSDDGSALPTAAKWNLAGCTPFRAEQ